MTHTRQLNLTDACMHACQSNLYHYFCKEKKQKKTEKKKKNPEVKLTALISLTCRLQEYWASTEITIEASLFEFKLYIPDVQRNAQPDG